MVPLSEDCGFIEWVPQTVTLRNVCQEAYAAEGLFDSKISLPTCRKIMESFNVSAAGSHAGFGYFRFLLPVQSQIMESFTVNAAAPHALPRLHANGSSEFDCGGICHRWACCCQQYATSPLLYLAGDADSLFIMSEPCICSKAALRAAE